MINLCYKYYIYWTSLTWFYQIVIMYWFLAPIDCISLLLLNNLFLDCFISFNDFSSFTFLSISTSARFHGLLFWSLIIGCRLNIFHNSTFNFRFINCVSVVIKEIFNFIHCLESVKIISFKVLKFTFLHKISCSN